MSSMSEVGINVGSIRIAKARCYSYTCLSPSHIRLLKLLPGKGGDNLECEVVHTSLETPLEYDALSYAWGNNIQDHHIRVKIGHLSWRDLLVTPNLLAALKRLRLPSDIRWLWVDQLCIAQHDDVEKAHQVQLMQEIYARAKKVVVWVGDDDLDTPLLEGMCSRISPKTSQVDDISKMHLADQLALKDLVDLGKPLSGQAKDRREGVERILNRAWFSRAWVYQEAIVATELEVYCGYWCVPFDILARLVLSTYYLTKIEKDGLWSRKIKRTKGFGPLRAIWYDRRQYRDCVPLDFLHILWRARRYLKASKPEDMVFSFLAFNDLSQEFKVQVDYKLHPRETFRNLACSMIKSSRSLDILQVVVPTQAPKIVEVTDEPPPDLPSWVPDWSNPRFTGGAPMLSPGMSHHFNACRGKEHWWIQGNPYDPKILHVKGHIVDTIYSVIPHKCEENTYFKASLREVLKLESLIPLLSKELDRATQDLDCRGQNLDCGILIPLPDPANINPNPNPRSTAGPTYTSPSVPKKLKNPKIHPRRTFPDLAATCLRALLADGSFSLNQPIPHSISELLRVYRAEGDKLFHPKNTEDNILHRYIRDAGTIAEGKRVFLTQHLDIGLGYSNLKKGDFVVLLYGSKAPVVLRKKHDCGSGKEYRFVGHAYLDGWMYGENPRNYRWWGKEKEAKTFALV